MRHFRNVLGIVLIVIAMTTGRAAEPNASDLEVEEVLIGYFGPASSTHPEGGDLWCAASMALERANRAGGCDGVPFRLVTSWSENPWGTGVADVARMAYIEKVCAIVGGIDGASTHLAEQVVAKARLALISPTATDKSVNMAGVPWMFSCVPLDDVQALVLAKAIAQRCERQSLMVVSAVDHDSQMFAVELRKVFKACKIAPAFHLKCDTQASGVPSVVDGILQAGPKAVVLIADSQSSAAVLRELRGRGYTGAVFGGPQMGRRTFLELAGDAAEGVVFPHPLVMSARFRTFAEKFAERFGRQPDYAAAHTYDALTLLTGAIRKAGSDRIRIRDAVRDATAFQGVAGQIRWNAVGANTRAVQLATIRNGRIEPVVAVGPSASH